MGKGRVGQVIIVTIDSQTQEWVSQDERGGMIRRQVAKDLAAARIQALQEGSAWQG